MAYKRNSNWNEINEMKCLLIYKKLEDQRFSNVKQMEYCRDMAKEVSLKAGSISAKVSNYKSVAGINNHSNASNNTKEIYKRYKNISIDDLINIINKKCISS